MDVKTLTIDGQEYPVDKFSPQVQNLLKIRSSWEADLYKERLAVAKTETALKSLDAELLAATQKELAPPEDK